MSMMNLQSGRDRFSRLVVRAFGALIALQALVCATPALAEKGKLRERLTGEVMAVVYPAGADRLGPEEGSPPAIAVYKDDKIAAYIFSTLDIIAPHGYSTTPFDVIGGVDLDGRITGAKVVYHNEPHIFDDIIRKRLLDTFLAREAGRPLRGDAKMLPPDFVAGATVSARAMRAAVTITAGLVLRPRLARPAAPAAATASSNAPAASAAAAAPPVDNDSFSRLSWDALLAKGAVVRRRITSGEVAAALANAGAADAKLDVPLARNPDTVYIEIATALFTVPAIGGNLIGIIEFDEYKSQLPEGTQAIFVAANGLYDFLGTKYTRAEFGRRFDRLRLVQNGQLFTFGQDDYKWINPYAEGIKGQQSAAAFALPANSGFDPAQPWRLELLVNTASEPPVTIAFPLDYAVPNIEALTKPDEAQQNSAPAAAAAADQPAAALADPKEDDFPFAIEQDQLVAPWVEAWHDSRVNVAILAVLLSVLTLIFIFQGTLARSRRAHRWVRNAFLVVVLVWLGWIAGAQLSIVNVINYLSGPFSGVDIGFYLAEPLMVMVAVYTLVSVLLIGRGVFCGWLCPFGAFQELLAQLSRALRVPQWNPPAGLEKRLWLGKYIAAVAVLALTITALDPSGSVVEIEPFKTVITSKFTRPWPYVLYAGVLLALSLFSERAYCRFLCPLGGILAFLDRLHLVNLLKRRPECGSPCHLCERSCPVRAIEKTGRIVTAECFQCLDCQVEYYDDKRCPPLVRAAKPRLEPQPVAGVLEHA